MAAGLVSRTGPGFLRPRCIFSPWFRSNLLSTFNRHLLTFFIHYLHIETGCCLGFLLSLSYHSVYFSTSNTQFVSFDIYSTLISGNTILPAAFLFLKCFWLDKLIPSELQIIVKCYKKLFFGKYITFEINLGIADIQKYINVAKACFMFHYQICVYFLR